MSTLSSSFEHPLGPAGEKVEKRQRVRRQEAESTQTRGGEYADKRRRVRGTEAESTGTRGGEYAAKRRRVRGRIEPEAGGAARLM